MRSLSLLALALLAALPVVPAQATTWHVPSECPTIQAGVDSAAVGDTVLVACDTYYEHDIIMKPGICLTSETGEAACVTIDAQGLGRGLICLDAGDALSIVGFTITGGDGTLAQAPREGFGGGIYCENSSPTLLNCTFSGNQADHGGGMACWQSANPTLTNCTFLGNTAISVSDISTGGGMSCRYSSLTLTDCRFSGNTAVGGGGVSCRDSPAWDMSTTPTSRALFDDVPRGEADSRRRESVITATDCSFADNAAHYGGGGDFWGVSIEFTGCTFSRNTASGAGESFGGGVHCLSAPAATLTSCTFWSNEAAGAGGGMFSYESSPLLASCTFSENTSPHGGGIFCGYDAATLTNCIIAFSGGGGGVQCPEGSATLTCCDVYGNEGGDWEDCIAGQGTVNDNFSENPLLCGDDNPTEPLTLHSDSPCAEANNPTCGLVGAWDVGCDTPVEAKSWGCIKAMFR